ncbi:hypothetical protein CPB97_007797 [Podila verticillata]|nr:hypothetical protein CPB97_007797 [Podila verticillata]
MATASPTYNILFLGETQSGKSTLIESLKKYADPKYVIDKSNIGDGCFSCTSIVHHTTMRTNLPSHSVSTVSSGGRGQVDYGAFLQNDQEDYEDELNESKAYLMEREESTAATVTFSLIDTPGLNDTSLADETNIALIFKALKSFSSINLVVITVANNPFTEGLRDSLKAYVNLLSEFNGIVVFVHTKIDYAKLHPDDTKHIQSLTERKRVLNDLMGRDTVPHLFIDNDIASRRAIRNCITQNALRNILAIATLNQPIRVRVMMMNKTEKMLLLDEVLKRKYLDTINAREKTLGGKNKQEQNALAQIGDLRARIKEHEQVLQDIKRDLILYDTDSLVLHHEELYQQGLPFLGRVEGAKTVYFPGKERAYAPGFIHHSIDHIDILERNVTLLQQAGGLNHAYWAVQFHERKHQNGLYVVKIYITKRKKFSRKIQDWRTAETTHQSLLKDCIADLEDLEQQQNQCKVQINELVELLTLDHYLLGKVSTSDIPSKVFQQLVEARVFVRDIAQSALNLERFYFQNKDNLDNLEIYIEEDAPLPVNTSSYTNDKGVNVAAETNSLSDAAEFNSKVLAIYKQPDIPPPIKTYSILFLGETQSGKSTLIESLKKYADPEYTFDKEKIGDGTFSHTKGVSTFTIETDLPSFFISRSGVRVDDDALCDGDEEDYEDKLNNRSYLLERDNSDAPKVAFNLIDTPGLNDTSLFDETNIAIIFKALASIESINLVVITVANNPFTEGLMDALKAYIGLLPDFNGNIVFVHTRFDYAKLHPNESLYAHYLSEKKKFLENLMGGQTASFLLIDNDIGSKRTARVCITQNTLRNLLSMAQKSKPIEVRFTHVNKTEKMEAVDLILKGRYEAVMETREETWEAMSKKLDQPLLVERLFHPTKLISNFEEHLALVRQDLSFYDQDYLLPLYEGIYAQASGWSNLIQGAKHMEYPRPEHVDSPDFIRYTLGHVKSTHHNVDGIKEQGGKDHPDWSVSFRRKTFGNFWYRVEIYIQRRTKHADKVKVLKAERDEIQRALDTAQGDVDVFFNEMGAPESIRMMIDEVKRDTYIIHRVTRRQVDIRVFHAMVAAGIFVRNAGACAQNLERFYLERRDQLEELDRNPDSDIDLLAKNPSGSVAHAVPVEIGNYSKDLMDRLTPFRLEDYEE